MKNATPEPLRIAYRHLADILETGEVGVILGHDAELSTTEITTVSLGVAIDLCGEIEAHTVRARLETEAPPRGSAWCLLIISGYGCALVVVDRMSDVAVNARGGDA